MNASWIIAWMRGLAAMSAPKCAVLAWLQQCCRFLHVPTADLGRSRRIDTARHHTQSLLPSLFCIGNVVVRRQDTSRARVQVVEAFVGDLRVTQVFNPRNLLPSSLGSVIFRRMSRVRSVYHHCLHLERRSWDVRRMRWSGLLRWVLADI